MSSGPFTRALLSSTLHGLPRVVTGQSRIMRIVWICSILTSFVAFCWHASLLYAKYQSEPLVTRSDTRSDEFEFPDILLCPSNPVSNSIARHLRNNHPDKLARTLNYTSSLKALFQQVRQFNSRFQSQMPSNHFLIETYNLFRIIDLVRHRPYQTVASVSIKGFEANVTEKVEMVFERQHTFCFKVSVSSKEMDYILEEMELVIYSDDNNFDNSFKEFCRYFGFYNPFHFGIKVYFTKPGTLPNHESHYLHIRPGFFYDVQLQMSKNQVYNAFKRPCSKKTMTFVDQLFPNRTIERSDLYKSCIDINVQKLFVEKCGCYDIWLTQGMIQPHIKSSYHSCFNITENGDPRITGDYASLLQKYKCYGEFMNNLSTGIIKHNCDNKLFCTKYSYVPNWSYLKWPKEHNTREVIEKYLRPSYKRLRKSKLHIPGWKYILNINNSKLQRSAFRNTFSKIRIHPIEDFCTVNFESLQYPRVNFLSDLGGILGLYAGMSILTLCELIEFIYTLFSIGYFSLKYRLEGYKKSMKSYKMTTTYSKENVSTSHWI